MQKYRSSLGLLVALLVVGVLFAFNIYAAKETQDSSATEEVTLSVTGMT